MFSTRYTLLAAAGCLCTTTTIAQSPPPDSGEQEREIVITGHRVPQLQSETLAATTVISREEIAASQPSDLFELLGARTGIQTTRTGSQGSQTSLFLRGSESDHTLILLDGVELNTASDGFARLEHLPPEQIERIEIVRGPHSSLYGSNAIGGVIQIFTTSDRQPPTGIHGAVDLASGTEGTRQGSAHLELARDRTTAGISVHQDRTDGIIPRNTPGASDERSSYRNRSANLNVRHAISDDVSLSAAWDHGEGDLDFDGGRTASEYDAWRIGADAMIARHWESSLQIDLFRDEHRTSGINPARSLTRRESLSWVNQVDLGNERRLALGIDHDRDELDYESSGARPRGSERDRTGLFAVFRGGLAGLETATSLRYDDTSLAGEQVTGRLAVGREIQDGLRLRASWGTAFKAPNLVDLYVDFPAFGFFANPELEAETAENLEAGLDARWLATDWSISVFENRIDDLITTNATFDSLTNVGRARIRGLEVSTATTWNEWSMEAELTLLDHVDRDTGEALARRPDELLSLRVNRRFNDWRLHLDWQVRGAQRDIDPVTFGPSRVAGNGIVNVAASWSPTERTRLRFRIGNLLDRDYEVVDGYNMHGRTALLSAGWRF